MPASVRPRDNARMTGSPHRPSVRPLNDRELDELQDCLDRVPAPLEALDVSMLDGFLCGLLVQPRAVPVARWLPHVTDVDARALPPRFDASRLNELVLRRHAELNDAITRRQWFDPWVFELSADEDAEHDDHADDDDEDEFDESAVDAVYPWVAGFATALELFPDLMALDAKALTEPLALVYRHLAPDDLEDADDLLAEIETLEPPADLSAAVEELVRATLLLADVSRPLTAPSGAAPRGPARRRGPPSSNR